MEHLPAPSSADPDVIDHHELSKRRRAAFDRAQTHSRAVMVMRRLFPVMAILCVGVYFLKSDFEIHHKDFKASVQDIQLTKNELKMINPRLEGHDEKSGSYLVLADSASQKSGSPHLVHLQKIDAKLDHPQNGQITLKADRGSFDSKSEIMELFDNIRIVSANGMKARLKTANIVFKGQIISSDQPVFIEMNGSTITANTLRIDGVKKLITFTDQVRVKLIKSPDKPVAKKIDK